MGIYVVYVLFENYIFFVVVVDVFLGVYLFDVIDYKFGKIFQVQVLVWKVQYDEVV